MITADGQFVGAQALDIQALGDRQLTAGQRDGLALQARVEDDLVPALGGDDGRPQRAVAAFVAIDPGVGTPGYRPPPLRG